MIGPSLPPGWRLHSTLGEGGTATVFLASDPTGRRYAIKSPLADSSPEDRKLFRQLARREATLVSGYRWPGIVGIEQMHIDADWLALSYCAGSSLDQVGRIEAIGDALAIFSAFATGLYWCEIVGLIHGDIKPHNVFLPVDTTRLTTGELSWVRLSDFSLGRQVSDDESTRLGIGTVGYLAPELVAGGPSSIQTELFALGVSFWELLTGRHPYLAEDSDPTRVAARVAAGERDALDDVRRDLPVGLSALIDQLLAVDPERRPQSVAIVLERLAELGSPYPVNRAIQPKHVVSSGSSCDDWQQCIAPDAGDLAFWSESDTHQARLIISETWRRGQMQLDGGQWTKPKAWIRPTVLRRQWLSSYGQTRWAERRQLLQQAAEPTPPNPLAAHLRALTKPATMRHLSRELLQRSTDADCVTRRGRLALQAGDIDAIIALAESTAVATGESGDSAGAIRYLDDCCRYLTFNDQIGATLPLTYRKARLWKEMGDIAQAIAACEEIVAKYEETGRPRDRLLGDVYKALGDLYRLRQDYRAGRDALSAAAAVYTELGETLELSRVHNNLGNLCWLISDFATALREYRQALRIQRAANADPEVASTLNNIASAYTMLGRFERALALFRASLDKKRSLGDAGEIARTLNNIGFVHQRLGDYAAAADDLSESLRINQRIGNQKEVLINLENLTGLTIVAGRTRVAAELIGDGLALAEQLSDNPHRAIFLLHRANLARSCGELDKTADALDNVRELLIQLDDPITQLNFALEQAAWQEFLGQVEDARLAARDALHLAREQSNRSAEIHALLILGRLEGVATYHTDLSACLDEDHLPREALLVADLLWSFDDAASLRKLPQSVNELPERIERGRIAVTIGRRCFAAGEFTNAEDWAQAAYRWAQPRCLAPDTVSAEVLLAQIAEASGDYEAAFRYCQSALGAVRTILEQTTDRDRGKAFTTRRDVVHLGQMMKALADRLATR